MKASAWRRGCLAYKLWDQQIPIYDRMNSLPEQVDEAVVLCARQFGKSHLGVIRAVENCLKFDDRCFLIMGPTLKQTREIVTPRLRRIVADAPTGIVRPSKSEGKWHIGTSELVMGGFDINSSGQRGKTVQEVIIEEIVDAKPDDYLDSLRSDIGPALAHSDAGKIIYLTTLPKIPDHPFITDTMAGAEMNDALYIYTIDDNRALTKAQYEACVRRAGGRETDDFKREYLCQIIRDRSVVIIPDFSKERHVKAFTIPPIINWELYIDWGGVRDLTVAQIVGYDFLRGMDLVEAELWFPPNTPTVLIVERLRAAFWDTYAPKAVYADAPGQVMVDLAVSHNFPVRTPAKSDWESALNNLANRFTQNKVEIKPTCKLTIQTCQSGTLTKNRTDFERSASLGHCDALATLMYGVRCLDRSSPYSEGRLPENVFKRPDLSVPPLQKLVDLEGKGFAQKGLRKF